MLRLSISARQALARLTLPFMLLAAVALVLAGQADRGLGPRLRISLDDGLTPLYAAAARLIAAVEGGFGAVEGWFRLYHENDRLRADNENLRRWRAVALTLEAQNQALRSALRFIPAPAPDFFTSKVIADVGGLYARSVLVDVPRGNGPVNDAVAMDGGGVAGHVVDAGKHSARVLLITDINSRVPVALGAAGDRALMVGTNGSRPSLTFWSPGRPPLEGVVAVTSAAGGVYPAGLPVGTVHYAAPNDPVIVPFAQLDRLRIVRIFEYGPVRSDLAAPHGTGRG